MRPILTFVVIFATLLGGAYWYYQPNRSAPIAAKQVALPPPVPRPIVVEDSFQITISGPDGKPRQIAIPMSKLRYGLVKNPDGSLAITLVTDTDGKPIWDKNGDPIVLDEESSPPCEWNEAKTVCTIDNNKPYEPYYDIVIIRADSTRAFLRRVKRSDLPAAFGRMKLLPSAGSDTSNSTEQDGLAAFAASFRHTGMRIDAAGNSKPVLVSTASSNGSLDVIVAIGPHGHVATDRRGNPILFDPAVFTPTGPLPEPFLK